MATSAGISRYKIDSDDWEHLTREDGLLEDQASSLAFKNDGTLIVGTQCHGLAIFNRTIKGEYRHSKNIVAPDRFGQGNISPVPLTPRGIGLPSNLINDIIVTKNIEAETIWIATNAGLVKSNDTFTKLEYWRGKDYVDKVRGLYGGAPKDWQPAPKEIMDQILPEDYLTCLAEDEQGVIWIGTRQNGFYIADPKTGKKAYGNQKGIGLPDNFVTKILILGNGDYLIGSYGGGIVKPIKPYKLVDRKPLKTRFNKDKLFSVAQNNFPKLPSKIKPPTIDELKTMQTKLERLKTPLPKIYAAYYGEDWKTQGDWVGHYGRQYAILCAGNAPFDHPVSVSADFFQIYKFIGPHHRKGDILRNWVHWLKTKDTRSTYNPLVGYRRQSEWDDHGETYPLTQDGPDLWFHLKIVNAGSYKISLYFFNKDGHVGHNRIRDYQIEIYPTSISPTVTSEWKKMSIYAENETKKIKPLVKSRVCDFWGGVHKSFVLTGNNSYLVKIDRNYTYNTIISLVAIDRLIGPPTIHDSIGLPWLCRTPYQPPKLPENYVVEESKLTAELWKLIDTQWFKLKNVEAHRKMRLALYRTANKNYKLGTNEAILSESLAWRLCLWNNKMRNEFNITMAKGWELVKKNYPDYIRNLEYKRENDPFFKNWQR
jgi:hypothetical protein